MLKSPEATDWLSALEQQAWFDRYKSREKNQDISGLKFSQFREFLAAAIYVYTAAAGGSNCIEAKFSYQQEMKIFKVFDRNNDHVIDRDEFAYLCQNWLERTYRRTCALVVVDVQNDFIDGSLALINGPAGEDGADVVPVINNILETCHFDAIVYTQDWHPLDHIGFHANLHLRKYSLKPEANAKITDVHEGEFRFKLKKLIPLANVFDTVLFDDGRVEQKLWPVHCVQNSWGAELHPKLKVVSDAIRIYKGTLSHVDAYSAFWDNMHVNETGLRQELTSRKVSDVFFCGLALDYCVAASALDSAKAGFVTYVIEDACRGIDKQEIVKRKKELIDNGVLIVNSKTIRDRPSMIHVFFSRAMALAST